ncbi:hypothetical protein BU813_16125 [Klebsiella pneumoniae subsp. pneumoniae]|uniref:Uncharacterized protein n=6 Tax=Gammaproteobacteria TaxID=1236 RepID=A0A0H3GK20_KLEPH|nr:hypothetical protein [Klebsiella pneumoniae]YP_005225862.1 hypothetical protein KPHS_15620 [Klebsiella pneumoniae subsp. pneumoniae HS11286]AIW70140.1 hypothetical protein KPNIH33_08195 [Klebsiella pneumoniae subsp. pneumoniae]AKR84886.1 hypothetical protein H218_19110 [Klebsiella pneumoniae DMC1097]AKR90368.1 hypothetical protein J052_18440 [Klebsiella pneumoniae 500_1420]AKR95849.1 hypothetical protein H224_18510 [Klebsiella pneumoniae UHKPC07]AKS01318.1 hypothetical protein H222_18570 [
MPALSRLAGDFSMKRVIRHKKRASRRVFYDPDSEINA